jgi:hypothetical protein
MYPLYRFRPVHKKKQGAADDIVPPLDDPANKRKEKQPTTEEDERRCDAVAQLLLEGKKGEELAQAVRNLDRERELHREMEMGYLGFDPSSRRNSYDMELGYDSRGPSPMLSAASSSSAASSLLHMPLPMYVPPSNFYGMNMNFPRRPSSVPLPIPDFSLRILLRVLPSLRYPRSLAPSRQSAASRGTHSSSSNTNTKVSCTPSTTPLKTPPPPQMTFHSTPRTPPRHNTPSKHSPPLSNPARTLPPHYPLDWAGCTPTPPTRSARPWGWAIAVRPRRRLCS